MNKRRTSLAISLTVMVGQASGLVIHPAHAADAIWQQMSGKTNLKDSKNAQPSKAATKTNVRRNVGKVAAKSPTRVADEHVMLLLNGNSSGSSASAPAAALSIHPSLSLDTPTAAPISTAGFETATAAMAEAGGDQLPTNLIAQLSPDHVIAQSTSSGVTATPIPPVVTGTVDLEEFKTTNVIDLKVSQSRTFKLRNKIVRTSISDPGIAEPVVVAENQMVILGKAPGSATMVLWDDAGNTAAIDILVARDYSELQTALREIDPRIIVKAFSVGGSDRVLLLGDVDHPESVTRAFLAANVFMDDRGMNVQVANNRLVEATVGEVSRSGGAQNVGQQSGALSALGSVDRYTFFPNTTNNISKAQVITSDGGRVTSLIKIRKVPLIVLHVTFMEMNTTTARKLATSLGLINTSQGFAFAVGGANTGAQGYGGLPFSFGGFQQYLPKGLDVVNGLFGPNDVPVSVQQSFSGGPVGFLPVEAITGVLPTPLGQAIPLIAPSVLQQAILFGAPGGVSFQPESILNLFTASNVFGGNHHSQWSVQPSINGLINEQRARILSEPSMVCISGERAAFLAGGEIPILQSVAAAGQAQQSVVFEPFGLRLNFIPVLMENGSVNLEISPEERIPSTQNALNIPGSTTNIPSFITRKAQTIVEMKPGQELFVGGLVTANNGREIVKLPLIGEIPVLGSLYRSKAFAKNESELVVAVRPEVILPGTPGQLKLPEEIGRVEGPRDTNLFQVEPTVLDERHYTSGRAERHQKTSPTLPEGAPIPDSN